MIETTRIFGGDELGETVVAIDPAVTNKEASDETGIIVAGKVGPKMRVIEDLSMKGSPAEWAAKAINAYHRHEASGIVVEVNQGGDMIKAILHQMDNTVPVKEVRATKGKHVRAEPVVALYEQGLVEHVNGLDDLEDQMMSWIPHESDSPDRVDALVWAAHHLMLNRSPSLFIGGV